MLTMLLPLEIGPTLNALSPQGQCAHRRVPWGEVEDLVRDGEVADEAAEAAPSGVGKAETVFVVQRQGPVRAWSNRGSGGPTSEQTSAGGSLFPVSEEVPR